MPSLRGCFSRSLFQEGNGRCSAGQQPVTGYRAFRTHAVGEQAVSCRTRRRTARTSSLKSWWLETEHVGRIQFVLLLTLHSPRLVTMATDANLA
ncbi:hypothetical protein ATANTOWER_018231 [Ataeniobius toweri]|uniref:Uncharacterized protein n=1 Tax=Ataeniobius toweri TaxID=208326 RepID=A0ABU7CDS4_9TELE|nr:hypothetical protein [Ataeniobius toweri]